MQPLVFGSNNRKAKSQATSNNNVNTKAKQPAETPVTPCWTVGDILFMRKKGDIDTMLDLLYDAGKLTEELTTFAANHYIDMEAGDREGKIRSRWPNGKREAELPAPVTGEIRSVDIKRDEKGVVQVDVEVVCEVQEWEAQNGWTFSVLKFTLYRVDEQDNKPTGDKRLDAKALERKKQEQKERRKLAKKKKRQQAALDAKKSSA